MTTVPSVTTSRPSENVKRLGLASTTGAVKSWSRSAKSKSSRPRARDAHGRPREAQLGEADVEAEERRERHPAGEPVELDEGLGSMARPARHPEPVDGEPAREQVELDALDARLATAQHGQLADGHAPHDLGQRPQQRAGQQREDEAQPRRGS